MTDYSQNTDFSTKDALADDDPEKIILGADIDDELSEISTAIASKANSATTPSLTTSSNVFTGSTNGPRYLEVENTSSGTSAAAQWVLGNGTRLAVFTYQGVNFSAAVLTNGPSGESLNIYTTGSMPISIGVNSTEYLGVTSTGTARYKQLEVGFRHIPQNAQTGNYTCVLEDAGKHIYHASGDGAGDTYTIPANASVAYQVGTTLTFINSDSNAVSIAITTDTMTLAGTTTTGTRTLAQNGVATAVKVTSTAWIISGSGLS